MRCFECGDGMVNYYNTERRCWTLRASAVQSETCHPWSATWKPHPPLDMWRYFLLKSPEGLSMILKFKLVELSRYVKRSRVNITSILDNNTWEAFMKSCAFLRVLLYSSAILHANIAWTAKATSHSWPAQTFVKRWYINISTQAFAKRKKYQHTRCCRLTVPCRIRGPKVMLIYPHFHAIFTNP